MMSRFPAYVLAGGKSRRFGSDKARALLAGRPMICRLADQLNPIVASLTVVADVPDKYADLDLPTIADIHPGLGPLGGLLTALDDVRIRRAGDWLLLAACDWVEIKSEWIVRLREGRDNSRDAQAVAFKGDHWQPVPAIYHVSLLPLVRSQLDAAERRMRSLLEKARTVALPPPPDWPAVPQINTPQQFRAARAAHPA